MVDMERRRELAESLQDVLNTPMRRASDPALVRALEEQGALKRRQRGMVAVMVGGWVVLAWLWIAKPAAVFDPMGQAAPAAPVDAEASLRYGMFLQGSRLAEFQLEQGRLPATLDEAGEVEEGLDYLPDTAGWTLRGSLGGVMLELSSQMSRDSFLGSSVERLRP